MTARQEITLTPSASGSGWTAVRAECTECRYVMFTGVPDGVDPDRKWLADHLAQHEEGRALDIEVDWKPSALCSVCDDGVGDIEAWEDEQVRCRECGTRWDYDGRNGTREETDDE